MIIAIVYSIPGWKKIPPTHLKSTNTDIPNYSQDKKGGHRMPSLENRGGGLRGSFMASTILLDGTRYNNMNL